MESRERRNSVNVRKHEPAREITHSRLRRVQNPKRRNSAVYGVCVHV